MNPDKFLTDLAALTGCECVRLQWLQSPSGVAQIEVTLNRRDNARPFGWIGVSGTGPTVEAAMQEARAKLAEHYA